MTLRNPRSWQTRIAQVGTTALGGFRMYWGTATLLAATSALALLALYPVLFLAAAGDGPSLAFSTVRGSQLGLTWSVAPLSPAVAQTEAVTALLKLLLGAFPAIAQIGLSLVLLGLAGLFSRHVAGLAGPDLHPGGGLVFRLEAPARPLSQLAAAPGAIVGLGPVAHVTTDCGQCSDGGLPIRWRRPSATHQLVSADSFRTLGIQVLTGREITAADSWDAPQVAVVSQTLAAQHFQFGAALGRQLKVGVGGDEWHTVVGVVRDPPATGFGASRQPPHTVYLSILQHPARSVDLLIRGPPDLFAFMRLWVASLRPELGLRRAVGARRRQVIGRVLARAALVGLAGVAFGLWFGPPVWEAIGTLVPDLSAWDAALLTPPALLLVGVAAVGAVLPAWRASREPPARLVASLGE